MQQSLGLLEEAIQLARELGYRVREEPLGDLPGGACDFGGRRHILINAAHSAAERLDTLLCVLAVDPGLADQPLSLLLRSRLGGVGNRRQGDHAPSHGASPHTPQSR